MIRLTCGGLRVSGGNEYVELDGSYYSAKNLRLLTPGNIYEFEPGQLGGIKPLTAKFVGVHDDPARVMDWQVLDRAARATIEARKAEKRALKDSPLMTAVSGIRIAHKGLHPSQRAAFEAWLLKEIRK